MSSFEKCMIYRQFAVKLDEAWARSGWRDDASEVFRSCYHETLMELLNRMEAFLSSWQENTEKVNERIALLRQLEH